MYDKYWRCQFFGIFFILYLFFWMINVNLCQFQQDMIDKVLGLQPSVRRRRQENTSETSSNKMANAAVTSPLKTVQKRLYQEQPVKTEEADPLAGIENTSTNPTQKPSKSPLRQTQVQEQIASPAIKHIKVAKMALTVEDMKNSTKLHLVESAKHIEMRRSQVVNKGEGDSMYKLKVIFFLLASLVMIFFAMSPSRKGDCWRPSKSSITKRKIKK